MNIEQNPQIVQAQQNIQNIQNAHNPEIKIVKRNRRKNFSRNKKKLITVGLTALVLIVATYAWFVGITRVQVDNIEVEVVTTEGISISLDGKKFGTTIHVNKNIIEGTEDMYVDGAYNRRLIAAGGGEYPAPNNVNHWTDAGNTTNKKGLEPVSSPGKIHYNAANQNDTKNSQAVFFAKTSESSEKKGYQITAGEITGQNSKGYISFDLFLKNSTSGNYQSTYTAVNDESIFLTKGSYVSYNVSSSHVGEGIENSVRVGFYALGRVSSNTTDASVIQGISCKQTEDVTSLCNIDGTGNSTTSPDKGYNWNIWEPNNDHHREEAITRYNGTCINRDSNGKYYGDAGYNGTNNENCTALSVDGTTHEGYVNTYAIKESILLSDTATNIYDGHNGYTNPKMTGAMDTLKDTVNRVPATRPSLLHIAPSSITKIRVYIWLEGQDIDNFDLAAEYQTLKVLFGFTKDRYDETDLPTETTS